MKIYNNGLGHFDDNNDDDTVSAEYPASPLPSGLNVQRPIYQIEELNRDTEYVEPNTSFKRKCLRKLRAIRPLKCLYRTVPALKWLPNYSWKRNFLSDMISGITVAIMHIPQGMAYGLLGGVPPVVGIYMAIFPVVVYFFFGTSRHVSIGTFAIVCLMTGKVVHTYTTHDFLQNGTMLNFQTPDDLLLGRPTYTSLEVAITVTLTVAIIQLLMFSLRLGIVSTLLSDTLVNGFTCASAFHVVASQLKDLFGMQTHKRRGYFSFPLTLYDAGAALPNANWNACFVSFISISLLMFNNEIFKSWLSKKTRIPFPIELVVVIVGTTLSIFLNLETKYSIEVIGTIPIGLPMPSLPRFDLIYTIFFDAFVITMVSYTITMSMALIFARQLAYDVNPNQELLALGLSNTVGSFFSCMPVTASLSRSTIQKTVGGVTQIASLVSCSILIVVLLWIGQFFEHLPRCVLASVIVVALKSMIMQFRSIVMYAKLSKWDALVWAVTFFVTLAIDISVGLGVGVFVSLLSIFVQGYQPYNCLLGVVPGTDLYLDIKRYGKAQEIHGMKIFRYSGGLSFASRNAFKQTLNKRIGFDAASIIRKRKVEKNMDLSISPNASMESFAPPEVLIVKSVILDFSAVTFVDPAGVEFLRHIKHDFEQLDIVMYIAACSGPVYEKFVRCDRLEDIESNFMIFPTLHDAVIYAKTMIMRMERSSEIIKHE